jgi:hypothetical protein
MVADKKLSADTRVFWVGLTIWGTIFACGPFIGFEVHLMLGVALTIIGLAGLLFLVRDRMQKVQLKFGLLLGVAIVTWVLFAGDIYIHHAPSKANSIPIYLGFFKQFGYPAEQLLLEHDNGLKVTVYGPALLENTHASRIAVICFHYDGTTETMDATGLQKSKIFSVVRDDMPIVAGWRRAQLCATRPCPARFYFCHAKDAEFHSAPTCEGCLQSPHPKRVAQR